MKSRLSYLLAGIAVVLVSLALWFRNVTIPCGIRPEPGVRESVEIFHWLDAWSLDHDGELPARLEDLLTADLERRKLLAESHRISRRGKEAEQPCQRLRYPPMPRRSAR